MVFRIFPISQQILTGMNIYSRVSRGSLESAVKLLIQMLTEVIKLLESAVKLSSLTKMWIQPARPPLGLTVRPRE